MRRAASGKQALYNIVTVIGVALLFGSARERRDHVAAWPVGRNTAWCMVVVAAIGFSLTWWARLHLGRMWSRWVVRKADHHIVQTGPYSFVRHPIYTGIGLAALAAAVILGTAFAYLGAALMILGFYIKPASKNNSSGRNWVRKLTTPMRVGYRCSCRFCEFEALDNTMGQSTDHVSRDVLPVATQGPES